VTWTGEAAVTEVRTRGARGWTAWRRLAPLTDLPEDEGNGLRGSELLWVGPSDGVQVRVSRGTPTDLRLVLIDPGVLPGDADPALGDAPAADLRAVAEGAPRPALLSRASWGADEDWRNSWSDIGYNFLVDRFGRTWVGRAGGADRPVRGAHTLGFNYNSVGVAVMGNFQTRRPSSVSVSAVVRLAAWKLDLYGRRPATCTWVRSEGSDLYRQLPGIRDRAQRRVDAY